MAEATLKQSCEPLSRRVVGHTFVHPLFDYLLIGGGLSLVVIPLVYAYSGGEALISFALLPWFILLSNSAHFAASTVRLYTKPGTRQALPFLTMALPLLTIGILSVCFLFADKTGPVLQAIYLTWSPFHYAAQAYGLAVMYAYRSGCQLSSTHKRMLWWIAILPFLRLLLQSSDKHFLWWFVPDATGVAVPVWSLPLQLAAAALGVLALLLPIILYVSVWRSRSGAMPLISLLVVVTNGIWFLAFRHYDGFVWATIFHGLQYLCIATIFHVKEQMARSENRRSRVYHGLWFYGVCVLLGYALFNCWPQAYILLGFGPAESVLLVIAVINIHHFIVDAYIWKLKPGDSNRQVIAAAERAQAPAMLTSAHS
jgi:hypothetical protein